VTRDVADGDTIDGDTIDGGARAPIPVTLFLGVLSVVLWAASYSWLAGITPPTQWISRTVSPWFLAEVAATVVGSAALVAGVLLARRSRAGRRRAAIWAAALGGFAATASAVSLAL
jgi:hypothetical protein